MSNKTNPRLAKDPDAVRRMAERSWLQDPRATENDLIAIGRTHWISEIKTDALAGRLGKKSSAA